MNVEAAPTRRFRRAGLFLAGCALLALVSIAVAVWVAGAINQDRFLAIATGRLSSALDRPVAASGFQISLPEGEFVIRGLQVGREPTEVGPGPPLFSIDEIRGNLGVWSLALARLHFESLAVEGLSLWELDDGSPPRSDSETSGPAFETLAARLSFSSDRISVSGTTIGYRNLPAPWEVRADDVAVDFRPAEGGGVDGEVRSGFGGDSSLGTAGPAPRVDGRVSRPREHVSSGSAGASIRSPGSEPEWIAGPEWRAGG